MIKRGTIPLVVMIITTSDINTINEIKILPHEWAVNAISLPAHHQPNKLMKNGTVKFLTDFIHSGILMPEVICEVMILMQIQTYHQLQTC